MIDEGDEDKLTLAEIYAEAMGPHRVAKQCLELRRPLSLGGRMSLGRKLPYQNFHFQFWGSSTSSTYEDSEAVSFEHAPDT